MKPSNANTKKSTRPIAISNAARLTLAAGEDGYSGERELEKLDHANKDSRHKKTNSGSRLQKLAAGSVMLAGAAVISVGVFLIVPGGKKKDEFCRSVNEKVNPCDNFYQYACPRNEFSSILKANQFARKKGKEIVASPEKCDDPDWTKLVKRTYSSCIRETESSIDSSGVVFFLKTFASALLHDRTPPPDSVMSMHEYVHRAMMGSSLFPGDMRERPIIEQYSPSNIFLDSSFRKIREYRYYFKYMTKILTLLGASQDNAEAASNTVIDFERKYMKKWTVYTYKTFVKNSLKNITTSIDVEEDDRDEYNSFMKEDFNQSAAHYYFVWKQIDELVPIMPYEFRKALATFATDDPNDAYLPDPAEVCYNITLDTMSLALAGMILHDTLDEDATSLLNQIIQDVQLEFEHFIEEILKNWALQDPSMAKEIALTVKRVNIQFGVPDYFKETMADESRIESIQSVLRDPFRDSFVDYYLEVRHTDLDKKIYINNDYPNEWLFLDYTKANAMFYSDGITLFAGALMPPLFDKRQPLAYNYGAIGAIIAHELVHSFVAAIKKVVTGEALTSWKDEIACLDKQYDERLEFGVRRAYVRSAMEDYADHGSVYIAYNAFMTRMNGTKSSSPLDDQKHYFLAFAQNWCDEFFGSSAVPVPLRYMNVHTRRPFRANIPLSNFPKFSQVMKCGEGDAMNYKDACLRIFN